jgi:hypothetical protein
MFMLDFWELFFKYAIERKYGYDPVRKYFNSWIQFQILYGVMSFTAGDAITRRAV